MSGGLCMALQNYLTLSLSEQVRLGKMWDKRLTGKHPCIPHEQRGEISEDEALSANTEFGQFASSYLANRLKDSTIKDQVRRLRYGQKVVGVGFGTVSGFGADWLKEATEAGFQTWWLDVSTVGCAAARKYLGSKWRSIAATGVVYPKPVVKRTEFRTALLEPDSIGLDLDTVEIWYLCRTLGCLSDTSAQITLEIMGQSLREEVDPERKNAIVIINALKNYNKGASVTSTLRTKGSLIFNIRRGAGRPVEVCSETSHRFFNKKVSAVTIRAR